MESLRSFGCYAIIAVVIFVVWWLASASPAQVDESFHRPFWDTEHVNPKSLPWGGWDELDQPNPIWRPVLPPVDGGQPWTPPVVPPAYANPTVPYCPKNTPGVQLGPP